MLPLVEGRRKDGGRADTREDFRAENLVVRVQVSDGFGRYRSRGTAGRSWVRSRRAGGPPAGRRDRPIRNDGSGGGGRAIVALRGSGASRDPAGSLPHRRWTVPR